MIFDALCQETINLFQGDVRRGAVFCDPKAEKPYYAAVYICQIGESSKNLLERRLIGLRWDEMGEFNACAPNHLLALHNAPRSMVWRAGNLLHNPEDHVARADAHASMLAESSYLQQTRAALQAETASRMDDLMRGFDLRISDLAGRTRCCKKRAGKP